MKVPEFYHYAETRTGKDDLNAVKITTGEVDIYYSYDTIVAFRVKDQQLICCENIFSKTTGVHLNFIEQDKSKRLPWKEFSEVYKNTFDEEWKNKKY